MHAKQIMILAAVLAGTGVAFGAFGAHGLQQQLERLGRDANLGERLDWFATGCRYQMYHALAMAALAAAAWARPDVRFGAVVGCFVAGTLLFSGSLYVMTFGGEATRKLGAVTPLGGLALLAGWTWLAVVAWRSSSSE